MRGEKVFWFPGREREKERDPFCERGKKIDGTYQAHPPHDARDENVGGVHHQDQPEPPRQDPDQSHPKREGSGYQREEQGKYQQLREELQAQ